MAESTKESIPKIEESNSDETEDEEQTESNEQLADVFEGSVSHEEEEKEFSYFDLLDAPKDLPEPVEITLEHLKDICYELGIIKLCWPDITHPVFEERTNFPSSYTHLNNKEKVLLLYAENFRQQYCHRYPNRKPLLLACENECGMQKMVCTTLRPSTLPYPELESWQKCAVFVADHIKYEPLEDFATLIPRHLYSPHTTFLRQSGHSFELATSLCSLLLGVGYDAYVVSGYAIKDVTLRIMSRVDSPYPVTAEKEDTKQEKVGDEKYKLKPPRDLRSKFMLMMKQRKIDEVKAEQDKLNEEKRLRLLEEEKRPPDELEGQRVHAWILVLAGQRKIETSFFIEPSTGLAHDLDTILYSGIESIWNQLNYWVNMQDCTKGLASLEYNLADTTKWEHLLLGEPFNCRIQKPKELEEEGDNTEMLDEKHLDMPFSWSMRIFISHEALKRRFPDGVKSTFYKRTYVEEYAPYVADDGLVTRITRFSDFDCTDVTLVEDIFENRNDKLYKSIHDLKSELVTDYFLTGREDGVIKHVFYKNKDGVNEERTIFFNHQARYDSLSKIECLPDELTEYYNDREDKLYYRHVIYTKQDSKSAKKEPQEGNRKPILKIIQKFNRDESKLASNDIAVQEFAILDREIHLKYHYGKGHVTASTRNFIKPPISEMGEGMVFKPELTNGYQAEIGVKPARQMNLFLLFEQQLVEEEKVLYNIREMETQISDFLLQRAHEMVFSKLNVSLYNKEQNLDFCDGMLEREEQQRACKEREIEEEIDYMASYFARLGSPEHPTYEQAIEARHNCLEEFKKLLLDRANVMQKHFEKLSDQLQVKKNWYAANHDNLTPAEEALYFEDVNNKIFYLHTLEIRLIRHKELSPLRYEEMLTYVRNHPKLQILNRQ